MGFSGLIAIPLISSPLVYLAGRVGSHGVTLHRRSYLVRILALLAVLLAWLPFVLSVQAFLATGTQAYQVETIWMKLDGISLLMAGTVLLLGTLVILFSGSNRRVSNRGGARGAFYSGGEIWSARSAGAAEAERASEARAAHPKSNTPPRNRVPTYGSDAG